MAQLKISGLAQLEKEIAAIAELNGGQIITQMLKEGTKEVKAKWEEETKLRHVDTGEMLKNIKSSRVKTNKYGKFTVTYPMGSERRIRRGKEVEVRHAEKAFYQHYGYFNVLTGKFHRGDRWVEIVEIKAEPAADRVMQTMWDKYLQEKQK